MIPKGGEGVAHFATRIMTDLIPKAADAYTVADLGMTAELLRMVAQDFDRAVDNLMADLSGIQSICGEALPVVIDAGLRERMRVVADAAPVSFKVQPLSAQADEAMRVLIDLHAHVETAERDGAGWAGPVKGRIWSFLEDHVARGVYGSAF